ncbi:density-regulated protein DRP1 [Morchella conica CCBAS932]|uniref:Translation machinery-associated protein 22 n=1 Tax=Morchella conica CCBAS932 TaxID=1392247 RepID=A0A3N4L595_9PEZI|nr:density-regulated protein DRP1 [Morchella conica CCBAS932]
MADNNNNEEAGAAAPQEPQARIVLYCGVCTLPPEYCEFGSSAKKCKEWLEENHPDLVASVYNTEAVEAAMSHLTVDALARAEKAEQAAEKKAIKETAKAERELAKKLSSKIVLKRVERAKRKHVIVVTGLEAFGLDLKKVAKDFGKKFACGSSVTKGAAAGQDEIVVQGDLSDDILEYIEEKYPEVPVDNIEQVEEKKKKKSEGP